ncbi:MAG: hypothetical protein ABIR47_00370, partial [Candidatus Kapaibacterium sp.]
NIWYFGAGAGIDFNSGAPVNTAGGQLKSSEGCATIADPLTGALLFYTDGVNVWNRAHLLMPNGQKLGGDVSSTQSSLIMPMPDSTGRYYIFTADCVENSLRNGLQYSVVDMRLDRGLGNIRTKNASLLAPATERLTAIRLCNGIDFWVLAHGWGDNKFYAWKVTAAGIARPVISPVGLVHTSPNADATGYLSASNNGQKLAVAMMQSRTVQLLDFDINTGIVSNPITLLSPVPNCLTYGVEFSPDNSKLYVSELIGGFVQYDISSNDEAAILATRYTYQLYSLDFSVIGALKLGPDGRIYCAIQGQKALGVINNPNAPGAAALYQTRGYDLGGILCYYGLPNFASNYSIATASGDTAICNGMSVLLHAHGGVTYQWSPAEGLSCTDCPDPIATPPVSTTYSVTITNANGCQATYSTNVEIKPPAIVHARIPRDLHLPPGSELTIPVIIDDPAALASVDSLTIRMGYRKNVIRVRAISTAGTAIDGWEVHSVGDSLGELRIAIARPAGTPTGTGETLLRITIAAYIGDTIASELPLSIAARIGPCATVESAPGLVRLDSICGMTQRLIEPISGVYALRGNAPNPLSKSTTIEFSLGLDGPTKLVIANGRGQGVATLIDGPMRPGAYSVVWDGSLLPTGTYYCTLTSGDWSRTMTMMIAR